MKKKQSAVALLTICSGVASAAIPDTEYQFGGMVNAVLINDSNVADVGVNIPPNTLRNKSTHSDTKIDATLSRVQFGTQTKLDEENTISTLAVLDFNNKNDSSMDPRVRELYVTWQGPWGKLEAGQTWTTYMDLRNIPRSVVEPTLSGVVFKRQPLIRWSQDYQQLQYQVALEQGDNDMFDPRPEEQQKLAPINIDTSGSLPDLSLALQWVGDKAWLRGSSVLSQKRFSYEGDKRTKTGYGFQLSGGIQLTDQDKLTALWNISEGNGRYLLGYASGPAINPTDPSNLDMRQIQGFMGSYQRDWTSTLTSVFAYGYVDFDQYDWDNSNDYNSTEYAMANLLWQAFPSLTLGVEYAYSSFDRNDEPSDRDNHRVMAGINWRY